MSESDVYRRQILTSKDDPQTERNNMNKYDNTVSLSRVTYFLTFYRLRHKMLSVSHITINNFEVSKTYHHPSD